MPDGGTLTVTAADQGAVVTITVSDTGIGMDDQTRLSIFTPFFTRKTRGIGLGLSVSKRIVESHDGTITVTSTPAAGTSFALTLPGVPAMAGAAS